MAIKIQGSTIIDDSKNIQENTGFYSDANNSALRPRSSSGGSYMQRWTGSTWETIFFAGNDGVNCYRNFNVSSPYKYYGDGSELTNIKINGFTATEGKFNNSWYSRIPVVASNGVFEIGKFIDFHDTSTDGNDYTYRLDNYSNGNLSTSGNLLVNGTFTTSGTLTTSQAAYIAEGNAVEIGYNPADGGNSYIELKRGFYPYLDFGSDLHVDFGVRLAGSGRNLLIQPKDDTFLYGVNTVDTETGNRVLRLSNNNRIVKNNVSSSRRYKKNIKRLTSEWFNKIYDIVPVSFNYKEHCIEDTDLMREGNYVKMGVIAEDLEESMPELVQFGYYDDQYIDNPNPGDPIKKVLKENPERTPITVNYESIFICAVGALQELRQRVIDLEEEVQTLKASLQTP